MTLNPQEEFVISRQLNDPADVGTNYVRAYIRNAKTDALITTLNLDDKGSQRFTKTWQVAPDPTGLGLYITVTTQVFTDSGYTTPSTVYGVEQHEHLVQDRLNPFLRNAVSGPDVDYKRIKKLLDEAIAAIPKAEKPQPVDLIPLSEGFQAVIQEIRDIKFPESKHVDLGPVITKLGTLERAITSIKIPKTDLTATNKLIEAKNDVLDSLAEAQEEIREGQFEKIKQFFAGLDTLIEKVNVLNGKFDNAQLVVLKDQREKPKEVKDSVLDEYLKL